MSAASRSQENNLDYVYC